MTLIVLEIHVPDPGPGIATDADLVGALGDLAPRFVTYFLSFLTLGIFWNAQHTQLNYMARANRHFTWIHVTYLAIVALMPFTTSLLAEFIEFRVAFGLYWLNLFLLGVALYASWIYATRAGLLGDDVDAAISRAIKRRIVVYQTMYAIGLLVALLVGTLPAIAFVVLTQLNSAIAPRLPVLSRF
jgi:uncharacterized membrane protein